MDKFINSTINQIKEKVGNKKVILGLSGGVDSSVAAVLIHKAIGKKLHCIFVDNGLLRNNEVNSVQRTFKNNFNINLTCASAEKGFLNRLKNVVDPEEKTLFDRYKLPDKPLNRLEPSEIRPSREALDKINQSLFLK